MKTQILAFVLIISICLHGFARDGGDVSSGDNFYYNGKVDFLFVVDNSSSSNSFKEAAVQEFTQFIRWMSVAGVDFQIGFTTTTCGHFSQPGSNGTLYGIPQLLTSSTQYLNDNFENRLRYSGNWGSDLEKGLCSSMKALDGSNSHQAFLRKEAALMIFYFSDEDDYSGMNVDTFISRLDQIKPPVDGKRTWIANFYGALLGDRGALSIEPGHTYIELSKKSNGHQFSLFHPNSDQFGINLYKKYLILPSK